MKSHTPRALALSALAFAAACSRATTGGIPAGPLPLKYSARETDGAIRAEDLMSRLYVFADDSMQGRETGTEGHLRSTAWIAKQAAAMGLEPAGDNGTFFQEMPMVSRRVDDAAVMNVGGKSLKAYRDFVAMPFRGTARSVMGANAVYAGMLGDTAYAPAASALEGKVAVYSTGTLAGLPRVGAGPLARAANAAAVVLVVDSLPPAAVRQARTPAIVAGASSTRPVPVVLLVTRSAAEAFFGAPLQNVVAGSGGATIANGLPFTETKVPARNVVAVLRGSDAALRGQYVAIGAHNDHVGFRVGQSWDHDSLRYAQTARWNIRQSYPDNMTPEQVREMQAKVAAITVPLDSLHRLRPARRDSIFNGADDDGSGSVSVLEIAEAFASTPNRPKRSLLFVWHTGEEKGLLGSHFFTDHPTVSRDSIVAQLNMDMVGRGGAGDIKGGNPGYLQLVGSRRLSTELGDLVEAVNKSEPQPFTFDYQFDANGHPENIYCRSDHYEYARWGIPVTFFTTGLHQDYHQITDEPQYIDYGHMARVARLVHDVADRVANLDHRPVVDKAKPDPTGQCRQ